MGTNDSFTVVKDCEFKTESYSVRNNGAILRHPRSGARTRNEDSTWVFGKLNTKTGFLELNGVRVHQIVATAFHGSAPSAKHVVVHLDTDRRNNRPENLHWVTRFENTLLTPHNCERVRRLCGGSIERFLHDVTIAHGFQFPPQFAWILEIPQDDALATHQRLLELASVAEGGRAESLDVWLDERWESANRFSASNVTDKSSRVPSLTVNALQVDWRVPSEFPCCPQGVVDDPIIAYYQNLKVGELFCRNSVYTKNVLDCAIASDKSAIYVLSVTPEGEEAVKPWSVAKIVYEGRVFLHYNLGSYFQEIGGEKYFQLAQGKEWNGGDCFDDYC